MSKTRIVSRDTIHHIPVGKIRSNPHQPRKDFGDLEGLAQSIKLHGVQQPITVSDDGDGTYTLFAGERRTMATRLAKIKTIPAIITEGDPAILALLENLQRQDLAPGEQADAFQELIDRGETQQSIADQLGIGRTIVAQKLRLLSLPKDADQLLREGEISEAAARQILRLELLDKVATRRLPKNRSWADDQACFLLVTPHRFRTTAEIADWIDKICWDLLMGLPRTQEHLLDKLHTKGLDNYTVADWADERYFMLQPDLTRLSDAQLKLTKAAAHRWVKNHPALFPKDNEDNRPGDWG